MHNESMLLEHSPRKHALSFKYAFQGIHYVLKTQANFRIHIITAILVIALAYMLRFSELEWIVLFITISFVFILELINTVFEVLVDHLWQEENPRAKIIKDVAAGAVLIGAIGAAIIGVFLFAPYFLV